MATLVNNHACPGSSCFLANLVNNHPCPGSSYFLATLVNNHPCPGSSCFLATLVKNHPCPGRVSNPSVIDRSSPVSRWRNFHRFIGDVEVLRYKGNCSTCFSFLTPNIHCSGPNCFYFSQCSLIESMVSVKNALQ